MTNAIVLNKTSNLVMPSHYIELDREEMRYVDGGIYLLNSFCATITALSGAVGMVGLGVVCAGGSTVLTALGGLVSSVKNAIFSFAATNPIALVVVSLIGAWLWCNADNFKCLAYDIITASLSGKGVECGISWFQLYSYVK